MQIRCSKSRKLTAFTLIEMIGVLAVIAILAALLIPKVFEAINNSRINNAAISYNTVKTALTDHYAKYGALLSSNGVALTAGTGPATNFDRVLLMESFIDKPFQVKVGDNVGTRVEIQAGLDPTTVATASNAAYDLDGTSAVPINDAGPVGASVVQAVITGATEQDAKDLNDRLDGPLLGSALATDDIKGRVKYAATTPTTIYIYLTHR